MLVKYEFSSVYGMNLCRLNRVISVAARSIVCHAHYSH